APQRPRGTTRRRARTRSARRGDRGTPSSLRESAPPPPRDASGDRGRSRAPAAPPGPSPSRGPGRSASPPARGSRPSRPGCSSGPKRHARRYPPIVARSAGAVTILTQSAKLAARPPRAAGSAHGEWNGGQEKGEQDQGEQPEGPARAVERRDVIHGRRVPEAHQAHDEGRPHQPVDAVERDPNHHEAADGELRDQGV